MGLELGVVPRLGCHTDDFGLGGEAARVGELGEGREEVPAGEVAGGPEDEETDGRHRREASRTRLTSRRSRHFSRS